MKKSFLVLTALTTALTFASSEGQCKTHLKRDKHIDYSKPSVSNEEKELSKLAPAAGKACKHSNGEEIKPEAAKN